MLNHITIMGRLVADPTLKSTTGGTHVTSFRIACDRDIGRDEARVTDFIDCVAWRSTAEFISKYFAKGMPILVDGRLQMREYTNKDGVNVTTVEVAADRVEFMESRAERESREATGNFGGNYGGGYSQPAPSQAPANQPPEGFTALTDDDIPF